MLPQFQVQYRHFQQMLYLLQTQLEQSDRPQLQESLAAAQTYFQEQILSVEPETFEPAEASRIYSFQVEINKQLRLLNTDLMFLQTARLSATQSQRRQQIGDRLTLLLRYCEGILDEK
ncbi:MAG: heterocyst frequency control protein PatD [Drouetiella hepatica Uher 2000/2452]|jgi:septum formation inhibitor MinC|uniref:Heterocyst frequency control protein PatD n=1 Tax=Drouetiella hepatica Uher 2000/2452 TaxID=904376 RepID=A0A951QGS4_9CYAN|nr:heterocyst frequency control protein PatD [Drouetiella hepatica Uher 2000/2452]